MNQTAPVAAALPSRTGQERSYGIDLLRCVAMFLVVVQHIFNHGGIGGATEPFSASFEVVAALRGVYSAAVDIFALISGYVMIRGSYKPRRLFALWAQAFFWSVSITAAILLFTSADLALSELVRSFFPFSGGFYWYLSCYAGLFLLIPILNRFVRSTPRKTALAIACAMLLVFSVLSEVALEIKGGDAFSLKTGWSVLWLAVMYYLGACIREHDLFSKARPVSIVCVLAASVALLWLLMNLRQLIHLKWDRWILDQMYAYNSLPVAVVAVCFLLLFRRMQIRAPWMRKLIGVFAPVSFGVFLIHRQDVLFSRLEGITAFLADYSTPVMVLGALGVALGVYLLCSGLDWVRIGVFRLLRVDRLCQKAEDGLRRLYGRFYDRFLTDSSQN